MKEEYTSGACMPLLRKGRHTRPLLWKHYQLDLHLQ